MCKHFDDQLTSVSSFIYQTFLSARGKNPSTPSRERFAHIFLQVTQVVTFSYLVLFNEKKHRHSTFAFRHINHQFTSVSSFICQAHKQFNKNPPSKKFRWVELVPLQMTSSSFAGVLSPKPEQLGN